MEKVEIEKYRPCPEALGFRKQYSTFKEAWENCPRGDWMLWIADSLKVDIHILTTAKALCANTVRHLMEDERSTKAVDTALLFGQRKCTFEELNAADADADTAAHAAYDAAAAYAAAYAAYAYDAYTAAYAAYAAAYAADAAAYAADADTADAAKKENQQKTADICRNVLTTEIYKLLKL